MADDSQGQDRTKALEAEVRGLTETVAALQAQLQTLLGPASPTAVAAVEATPPGADAGSGPATGSSDPAPDARITRRGALALGAAAAVGIGAVADSVLSPTPAWATTGTMQYGAANNAGTAATDLTSSAPSQTLSIENTGNGGALLVSGGVDCQPLAVTSSGQYNAIVATLPVGANDSSCIFGEVSGLGSAVVGSIVNPANSGPAVYGFTNGLNNAVQGNLQNAGSQAAAVLGLTGGTGAGVEGTSTSGYGLSGRGGQAPLFLTPAATAGAPTAGTHAVGELYVDSAGIIYSCQGAGTPGTWVPLLVAGANDVANDGSSLIADGVNPALLVQNSGSGISLAVTDNAAGTAAGVYVLLRNTGNSQPAVEGVTHGPGPGLLGQSTGAGYGASLAGGLAPLHLTPAASAGPPATGSHVLGELYVDSNGVQYRCAAAGTPGTWVPQYSVVPLPSPVRVINTSTGEGGISGPLVPGATVHTSAALAGTNGIPDGAIGLVANLALSGVGGAVLNGFGVLTIFPAGTATPATANINAGAGCYALSNTVTVAFGTGANAGQLSLVWDGGGAVPNAQAYLDVTAYLL